jgi:hypothetical protein
VNGGFSCAFRTGLVAAVLLVAGQARAQEPVDRSRDRGEGIPTSMFGTYIRDGEVLVYPFLEYYRDGNYEYEPGELGYVGSTEFRGRYRATEGLIFVGYVIGEAQLFLTPNIYLKLNNAFGVTSKATDWAPEVGLMLSFR